jgi:hypothetical protein
MRTFQDRFVVVRSDGTRFNILHLVTAAVALLIAILLIIATVSPWTQLSAVTNAQYVYPFKVCREPSGRCASWADLNPNLYWCPWSGSGSGSAGDADVTNAWTKPDLLMSITQGGLVAGILLFVVFAVVIVLYSFGALGACGVGAAFLIGMLGVCAATLALVSWVVAHSACMGPESFCERETTTDFGWSSCGQTHGYYLTLMSIILGAVLMVPVCIVRRPQPGTIAEIETTSDLSRIISRQTAHDELRWPSRQPQ